jgi:hypothetical protein
MSPDLRRDTTTTAAIGLAATAAAVGLAVLVHLAAADPARELLGYRFAPLRADLTQAASIFATNARKLAGVLGLALVVRSARPSGERGGGRSARWAQVLILACDAGVVGVLGLSLVLVAAGLGAYGREMAAALLPHGPLELAAFALALSLYRDARRRTVTLHRALTRAALGVLLLAAAALLETYAGLPT